MWFALCLFVTIYGLYSYLKNRDIGCPISIFALFTIFPLSIGRMMLSGLQFSWNFEFSFYVFASMSVIGATLCLCDKIVQKKDVFESRKADPLLGKALAIFFMLMFFAENIIIYKSAFPLISGMYGLSHYESVHSITSIVQVIKITSLFYLFCSYDIDNAKSNTKWIILIGLVSLTRGQRSTMLAVIVLMAIFMSNRHIITTKKLTKMLVMASVLVIVFTLVGERRVSGVARVKGAQSAIERYGKFKVEMPSALYLYYAYSCINFDNFYLRYNEDRYESDSSIVLSPWIRVLSLNTLASFDNIKYLSGFIRLGGVFNLPTSLDLFYADFGYIGSLFALVVFSTLYAIGYARKNFVIYFFMLRYFLAFNSWGIFAMDIEVASIVLIMAIRTMQYFICEFKLCLQSSRRWDKAKACSDNK